MKETVGGYIFDYPVRHRDVKAWNNNSATKEAIEDNRSKLGSLGRTLCKIGLHNRSYDRKLSAWVLEEKVWYCNRCGICHDAESHWHSD
jgi:hypothetical protein